MTSLLKHLFKNPLPIALVFCLVMVIFSRFAFLKSTPPGFYLDESSISWNAYNIQKSGVDEHQTAWPVFFEAFGEWKNPLYIYSQAIIFSLLSPSIYWARFTSALWGLLAILVVGSIGWHLEKSVTVGLFTALIVAVFPWHWLQSRIVFEVISFPTILFLAILCAIKFHQSGKIRFAYLYSLMLGVSFYSYTAARFMAPLLLLTFVVVWAKQLKTRILGTIVLFLMCLLPAFIWERLHPGSLTYALMRVAGGKHDQPIALLRTGIQQYATHFSPQFWLGKGDGFLRHGLGFRSNVLLSLLPLVGLGITEIISSVKKKRWYWLIIVLCIVGPLPSAITVQAPHALRSVGLIVGVLLVVIVGGIRLVKTTGVRWIIGILLVAMMSEFLAVYTYAQQEYQSNAEVWFDTGMVEVFTQAISHQAPYYLSETYNNEAKVTWLFLLATVDKQDEHFEFLELDQLQTDTGTLIVTKPDCDLYQKEVVFENYQGCVIQLGYEAFE